MNPNEHGSTKLDPRCLAAMAAWSQLALGFANASAIQFVKDDMESLVLRLHGVGPERSNVIAKRGDAQQLARQLDVQNQVIGSWKESCCSQIARHAAPLCYGLVQTDNGNWLFQEDVGGRKLRRKDPEHGVVLSRLVGLFHRDFSGQKVERLPEAGPNRHRADLESALVILRNVGEIPDLTDYRKRRLAVLLQMFEVTRLRWKQVESTCSEIPETLVHGDLHHENVRIIWDGAEQTATILDWEWAGWGVPVIDLASGCVDLSVYESIVQAGLRKSSLLSFREYKRIGKLFRHITWADWALHHLKDALAPQAWAYLDESNYDECFRVVGIPEDY